MTQASGRVEAPLLQRANGPWAVAVANSPISPKALRARRAPINEACFAGGQQLQKDSLDRDKAKTQTLSATLSGAGCADAPVPPGAADPPAGAEALAVNRRFGAGVGGVSPDPLAA
eukprot:7328023-Alexandrium_andersonii.AAC.1